MNNYREINVWKKSRFLLSVVYKATDTIPEKALDRLKDQIRNNCIEHMANLTKGLNHKRNEKEQQQFSEFFTNPLNSLMKLKNQFHKANNLKLIDSSYYQSINKQITEIIHIITILIQVQNIENDCMLPISEYAIGGE